MMGSLTLPEFSDVFIKEGVRLSHCRTDDFKSAVMTVSFAAPLDKNTASGYSLLTNLLSLATAKHPDMQTFSLIKDELYALELDAFVQRMGEILLVTLELGTISDKYALEGENLLENATALLGEVIFDPLLDENGAFPNKNVESEKLNLIDEIESIIENKSAYAFKRAREILCPKEPFSVDSAGETERVKALNGKELYDNYYKKCIDSLPVYITYAGDASKEYVVDCINKHLPFKARKCKPFPTCLHKFGGEVIKAEEFMESEQCQLIMGFCCDMPDNRHDRAALSVFNEIYGGYSVSKLFMNVREKEGLCYYCSTLPSGRKNLYFVTSAIAPENADKTVGAIMNEMESMRIGNFTDEELQLAEKSVVRSISTIGSNLGSLTSYMSGQALLGEKDTTDSLDQNIKAINEVTREDVIKIAEGMKLELIYTLKGSN